VFLVYSVYTQVVSHSGKRLARRFRLLCLPVIYNSQPTKSVGTRWAVRRSLPYSSLTDSWQPHLNFDLYHNPPCAISSRPSTVAPSSELSLYQLFNTFHSTTPPPWKVCTNNPAIQSDSDRASFGIAHRGRPHHERTEANVHRLQKRSQRWLLTMGKTRFLCLPLAFDVLCEAPDGINTIFQLAQAPSQSSTDILLTALVCARPVSLVTMRLVQSSVSLSTLQSRSMQVLTITSIHCRSSPSPWVCLSSVRLSNGARD